MANPLVALMGRGPDIGGNYAAGVQTRRNALLTDMMPQQLDLQRRQQEMDMAAAGRKQMQEGFDQLGRYAKFLKSVPPEQRAQVFQTRIAPQLQRMGFDEQALQIGPEDLTDQSLDAFIAQSSEYTKLTDTPTSYDEYQLAQRDPMFAAWNMAQNRARGTSVNVNAGSGPPPDPIIERLRGVQGDVYAEWMKAGYEAPRRLARLDQLENVLSRVDTGAEAAIKNLLGEFGINTEGLSEIQAAQALINQMVPEQRPPGTGVMSDADLALYKASVPRLINQPGGNQLIIETARAINQYDFELGRIAQRVANQEITREQANAMAAQLQNPVRNFSERAEKIMQRPSGDGTRQMGTTERGPQPNAGTIPAPADLPDSVRPYWEFLSDEERQLWLK